MGGTSAPQAGAGDGDSTHTGGSFKAKTGAGRLDCGARLATVAGVHLITPPQRPAGVPAPPVPIPAVHGPGLGARVWLVRHARVAEDYHAVAYGDLDVPLSAEGEAQTAATGRSFAAQTVDSILSSDLVRAAEMGRAIAANCGAPLRYDPALREIDRGDWQGLPKLEFRDRWHAAADAYWQDPWNWRVPGGDSDAAMFARAWPVLEQGIAEVAGGTLVVTAHANLIRVLIGRALGITVEESYRYSTDPAMANLLVDGPDGLRIELSNGLPGAGSEGPC